MNGQRLNGIILCHLAIHADSFANFLRQALFSKIHGVLQSIILTLKLL